MASKIRTVGNVVALIVLVCSLSLLFYLDRRTEVIAPKPPSELSANTLLIQSPSTAIASATKPAPPAAADRFHAQPQHTTPVVTAAKKPIVTQSASAANSLSPDLSNTVVRQVARIEDPYSGAPPLQADSDYALTERALVNILCRTSGVIQPISGSGVIIDPRGVILTNAHVAQYVLLSEAKGSNLDCMIRTGSPASPLWKAAVLFIPQPWVAAHASQINTPNPTGTGVHDYALLFITATADNKPLQSSDLPFIPFDTREAVSFPGDTVLAAGYPAEFIGAIAAVDALRPEVSATTVQHLLTFGEGSVDLLSLSGVVEAQSGSSGGPVVNAWGRLVGMITTTSSGATTEDRDLHALTLSYINSDLKAQTGSDLSSFLSGDLAAKLADFNETTAPSLIQQYIDVIKARQ